MSRRRKSPSQSMSAQQLVNTHRTAICVDDKARFFRNYSEQISYTISARKSDQKSHYTTTDKLFNCIKEYDNFVTEIPADIRPTLAQLEQDILECYALYIESPNDAGVAESILKKTFHAQSLLIGAIHAYLDHASLSVYAGQWVQTVDPDRPRHLGQFDLVWLRYVVRFFMEEIFDLPDVPKEFGEYVAYHLAQILSPVRGKGKVYRHRGKK